MQLALSYDDVLLRPGKSLPSRSEASTTTMLKDFTLQVPIISANMDTITESAMAIAMGTLGGLGIIHRFMKCKEQMVQAQKCNDAGVKFGMALGVQQAHRIDRLLSVGCRLFCIDVANGYSDAVADMCKEIKDKDSSVCVIAGNVASGEGAEFLQNAGADIIKAGIGGGSLCTTRIVTGCGVPNITALQECCEVADYVIADGGIKAAGDVVKALAVGADAVMIGGLIKGTNETPGDHSEYRGMASESAQSAWEVARGANCTIEGVSMPVKPGGPVCSVLEPLVNGIKSGMSYIGAMTLSELQTNADFVQITSAGMQESLPHGLAGVK